jgi:hypothetical protein
MVVAIMVLLPPNKPPRPPLKFPCVICSQEHYTHDCPHKYEIHAMFKSQTKNTSIDKPISANVVGWQLEKEQLRNDFITTMQLMQSNVENGGSKTNDTKPISVSGWVSKLQLFHHPLY